MRRVVVTGLGMVTPLGCGVEPTWTRILAGRSGAKKIETFEVDDLASQDRLHHPAWRRLRRHLQSRPVDGAERPAQGRRLHHLRDVRGQESARRRRFSTSVLCRPLSLGSVAFSLRIMARMKLVPQLLGSDIDVQLQHQAAQLQQIQPFHELIQGSVLFGHHQNALALVHQGGDGVQCGLGLAGAGGEQTTRDSPAWIRSRVFLLGRGRRRAPGFHRRVPLVQRHGGHRRVRRDHAAAFGGRHQGLQDRIGAGSSTEASAVSARSAKVETSRWCSTVMLRTFGEHRSLLQHRVRS